MEATKWTNEQKIAFAEYCMDKPSYVNLQTLLHDFEKASMPNKADYKDDRFDYEILYFTGNNAEIIRSVKRLSDNEVFTIGDVNEYPTGHKETIKEFKISDTRPLKSSQNMILFRTDTIWANIETAKKSKQPLLTTVDTEDFIWDDELVKEYAKWYLFSASRITTKLFKELQKENV